MTKELDRVTRRKQQLFWRGERFNSESPVELIGIMGLKKVKKKKVIIDDVCG